MGSFGIYDMGRFLLGRHHCLRAGGRTTRGAKNFGRVAKGGEKFWTSRQGGAKNFGQAAKGGGAKNFGLGQYFLKSLKSDFFMFLGCFGHF